MDKSVWSKSNLTLDKIQMHFIFDDGGFDYFMTTKKKLIPNEYTMLIVESIQTQKKCKTPKLDKSLLFKCLIKFRFIEY